MIKGRVIIPSDATPIDRGSTQALGLVGFWPMCEGSGNIAYDRSGGGNHGSLTNGPTYSASLGGFGVKLDGTNDYVITQRSFSLPSRLTITCTAKLTDGLSGSLVMQRHSASSLFNFQFYCLSGEMHGRIAGTSTSIYIGRKSSAITDGLLHDYSLTWDGGSSASGIKLYIDGIRVDSSDDNLGSFTAPSTNSFPIEFGSQNNGTAVTNIYIRNIRIYNRVLSENELIDIRNNPLGIYQKRLFPVNSGFIPKILFT